MGITRALAAVAAAFAFTAVPAAAQNFVVNPSFESGDTTSWTITGTCPFDVMTAGPGTTTGAGAFPAQSPTQGTFLLMSDAVAPGVCTLFQDIALPAGQSYALSFAAGYNYFDFVDPTAAGCDASIAVTTTGGVPITTPYSRTGPVNDAIAPRGPFVLPAGVAGTTVRLIITTTSCAGGPAGIVADNFLLAPGDPVAVPTLSQWALVLLSLLMAAAAVTALRRRAIR